MNTILIGNHPLMVKIRELISTVRDLSLNVLILGETGTGKDVVARLLHQTSTRRKKRFIKVNCAALPLPLLESELFGYEKGAFTGADKQKPGKFEQASGGVILLDEIGDMPKTLQSKLLSVLQDGTYNRLGGVYDLKADAWVIASTNHDLNEDIKKELFREDLYYRLNIIKIEIPPLRERREDIPLLTEHFLKTNGRSSKKNTRLLIDSDMEKLFQHYHWPGNVRELISVILRLSIGDDPERIKLELTQNMREDNVSLSWAYGFQPENRDEQPEGAKGTPGQEYTLQDLKSESSDYIEKKTIGYVLKMTESNKSKAAKKLKISYKALLYKMENLGIYNKKQDRVQQE